MIFTSSLLLLISLSSPTVSSVPTQLNNSKSKTPYLCSKAISANTWHTKVQNRIQLPDRYITTWSKETIGKLNNDFNMAKSVLIHGSNTSTVIKSKSSFKWPPFILFGNETFKFEFPTCKDEEINNNCTSWGYDVKEFEPSSKFTFFSSINGVTAYFFFDCKPLSEKDYDQLKEENKFGEMSKNDVLKLCQHFKTPGYCPKLTETQLKEQTPREQPIEAETPDAETPDAGTPELENSAKIEDKKEEVKSKKDKKDKGIPTSDSETDPIISNESHLMTSLSAIIMGSLLLLL